MAWDMIATLLLSSIVIQSLFFPISLVYYFKIIQPNKDKLFWKIRRPNYFIFYILITLFSDTIRCTTGLLLHTQIINQYWYSLLSVPLAYFGGITWGSIRLWLLYYDIKLTRKSQYFLLSTHLTTGSDSSISHMHHKSPYLQQKRYISVTWRVFTAVVIFTTTTLLFEIFGFVAIAKLLLYSFILLLLLFYTYYLFKLCCCCSCCSCCKCTATDSDSLETSPFRDDWLLLLELSIIWVIWIVGIFGAFAFLPFRGQTIYPVLIAYLTMITRVIITITMLILPYKVSLRSKETNKKISVSVLKSVLSNRSYFFAFVEHLVHEMAIENLTALVEIWQFKYEHKYHLEPSRISKQINKEIAKASPNLAQTPTESEWFKASVSPTISYESTYNLEIVGHNEGLYNQANQEDLQQMVQFLQSMPWKRLPLAQSVASNLSQIRTQDKHMDMNMKWRQCELLFAKYYDDNSYDALNVSYSARYEVHNHYNILFAYAQNKASSLDVGENGDKDNEIVAPTEIKNDEEFKDNMLKVFDWSINDLVQNLQDSLTRFVSTEEFKLAH